MKHLNQKSLLERYDQYEFKNSEDPFLKKTLTLASTICNTDVAYISLLDENYQYTICQKGSSVESKSNVEDSICQYTIKQNDILVINDTRKDPRTQHLRRTIGDKGVGFYAGVPLLDDDKKPIGAFCVTNQESKILSNSQKESLKILGEQASSFLRLKKFITDVVLSDESEPRIIPKTISKSISQVFHLGTQIHKPSSEVKYADSELKQVSDLFPGLVAKIDKNHNYVFANNKYQEVTGIKPEDLVGKPVEAVVGVEKFKSLLPYYDRVFQGEKIVYEGFFFFNNQKKYLRITYTPIYSNNGSVEEAYVFTEDFTDVKSNQSQLENSNKNLENFAHVVSHDIKAPLRTIYSFADLLRRDLDSKNIEYKKKYLSFIEDGAKNLTELTTDLLDFAKVKQASVVNEVVSIQELLNTVELNLYTIIAEKNASISYPDTDYNIVGQKTDFLLLFQNLISNAIKYSKTDVTPEVQIEFTEKGDSLEFAVIDNGTGIPDKYQSDVFLPFKRVSSNSKAKGTGIGLATCAHIVSKYQSEIDLNSKVDIGSVFTFSLPLCKSKSKNHCADSKTHPNPYRHQM